MTANSDGKPALFQPRIFSRKAAVCSREKTPNEKRMKSRFAISSARRSISSSLNGRRINRGVSRTAMELMKTNSERLSIHNRRCQQTARNMRGLPHRQIHRILAKFVELRANVRRAIFTSARRKLSLARDLRMRQLCWLANNQGIMKTSLASRLSDQREKSWTALWRKQESIAAVFT